MVATVQEVQAKIRSQRTTDMEIALQDFLGLPDCEQREMLFSGLLEVTAQVEFIQKNLLDLAILVSRLANK